MDFQYQLKIWFKGDESPTVTYHPTAEQANVHAQLERDDPDNGPEIESIEVRKVEKWTSV